MEIQNSNAAGTAELADCNEAPPSYGIENKKIKITDNAYDPYCSEVMNKDYAPTEQAEDKTSMNTNNSLKPTLGATLHLSAITSRRKRAILIIAETFAKLNNKTIICECMIEDADKFLAKHQVEISSQSCDWSCSNATYCHELI